MQVVRGQSLDIPLRAVEVQADDNGIEISRSPLDLSGAELSWELRDCEGNIRAAKTSAAGGIEILAQAGDDIGAAVVHLTAADLDIEAGAYSHEAWAELADGRRGPLIPPEPFIILPSRSRPGAAAPEMDGRPAAQTSAERSFRFVWPATGSSATITVPGDGMLRVDYHISHSFDGAPPLIASLVFGDRQPGSFSATAAGGGVLMAGTKITFHLRDIG